MRTASQYGSSSATEASEMPLSRSVCASAATNAEAEGELLDKVAKPDAAGSKLLTEAAERIAEMDGLVWVDLGDDAGDDAEVVIIDADGSEIWKARL